MNSIGNEISGIMRVAAKDPAEKIKNPLYKDLSQRNLRLKKSIKPTIEEKPEEPINHAIGITIFKNSGYDAYKDMETAVSQSKEVPNLDYKA